MARFQLGTYLELASETNCENAWPRAGSDGEAGGPLIYTPLRAADENLIRQEAKCNEEHNRLLAVKESEDTMSGGVTIY